MVTHIQNFKIHISTSWCKRASLPLLSSFFLSEHSFHHKQKDILANYWLHRTLWSFRNIHFLASFQYMILAVMINPKFSRTTLSRFPFPMGHIFQLSLSKYFQLIRKFSCLLLFPVFIISFVASTDTLIYMISPSNTLSSFDSVFRGNHKNTTNKQMAKHFSSIFVF